jgi:hypothetical protein
VSKDGAIIGVSDHAGWAILVTVARDGTLLDRRRVELIDRGLPTLPYHHDAQGLPLKEALELIERVRLSAARQSKIALEAVSAEVPSCIMGVAIRACPPLPPTVAERLSDYRSQNVADTVMYRKELASAAEARGWNVYWYEAKKALSAAAEALRIDDIEAYFLQVRKSAGPPWAKDHRIAMAAAVVMARAGR